MTNEYNINIHSNWIQSHCKNLFLCSIHALFSYLRWWDGVTLIFTEGRVGVVFALHETKPETHHFYHKTTFSSRPDLGSTKCLLIQATLAEHSPTRAILRITEAVQPLQRNLHCREVNLQMIWNCAKSMGRKKGYTIWRERGGRDKRQMHWM